MSRMIKISDESLRLIEYMNPLTIDDVITMFAKTYIGIASSMLNEKDEPVKEDVYEKIQHLTLTVPEYEKLCKKYKKEAIDVVIRDMKNYNKLKNYKSAYLTARKWLDRAGKDVLLSNSGVVEYGSEEWRQRNA